MNMTITEADLVNFINVTGMVEMIFTDATFSETHGSIIEAVSKFIAPTVMGREIANLNPLTNRIQKCIVRNFSAKAAVEIALYDLFGQLYGAPLYRLLGGGDNVITTDITISVDYIDKMVADAREAILEGGLDQQCSGLLLPVGSAWCGGGHVDELQLSE